MILSDLKIPQPLGTLAFLAAWMVPWRPAYRIRAAKSDLAFFVHHRDAIGRHIAKYGTHEPLVTRWIAEFLGAAQRGIVVDVGANLGWHALHASRHRSVETVVAFEPDPFNAWLLERNLSENQIDNVIVDSRAVGASPGIARLFRYKSANFGRHSIAADHGHGSRMVPVTDVDSALSGLGLGDRPVSLIKIDVEGYEPMVLKGLTSAVPYISFEVNLPEFQPEAKQCVEWLEDLAPQGEFSYAADCRFGLIPERWLPKGLFLQLLNSCVEPCIEIFWKAPGQPS